MAKKDFYDRNPGGFIEHDHNADGIDRRGFLKCMAWAGTGALCIMQGGVLKSAALASQMGSSAKTHKAGELTFVQISSQTSNCREKERNCPYVSLALAAFHFSNTIENAALFLSADCVYAGFGLQRAVASAECLRRYAPARWRLSKRQHG